MANRIKGITVEIGGDVTGLDKALKGVNKNIRDTQSELKDVNRLLRLDPTNTNLLKQKQELLAGAVGETKTKLDSLKQAEKQVQEQFKKGDVSKQQYDALQREIIDTEQDLKRLERQAQQSNATLSKIGGVADSIASTSGKISSAMMPATAAIGGLGALAFKNASDVVESMNKVDVAFKDSADEVKEFAETTLEKFGIAKGDALEMASLFGDMGTSMGISTGEAADMSITLTGLAGDLASFKNIGIDEAMTALKGVFTGETESLKNIGYVMTQNELRAYAMSQGIEKNINDMTSAEKVQLRYAFMLDATKNAQGDAERTMNEAAGSMRSFTGSMKEASASIGQELLPIITPLIQKVTNAVKWFGSLDDTQKKMIITVLGLIAAIGPIAGIISAISTAISGVSMALQFLSANPIMAVYALVLAFMTLWETSETFRNFFLNMWDAIVLKVTFVKDMVVTFFTVTIPEAFQSFIDFLKGGVNSVIGLINMVINGINYLINGLNKIQFSAPSWVPVIGGKSFGINIPNIPDIPMLAKGGTVHSGMAIVGEAGPELLTVSPYGTRVTPLTGGTGATAAAGKTINIGRVVVNGGATREDARAFVRELNRELGKVF